MQHIRNRAFESGCGLFLTVVIVLLGWFLLPGFGPVYGLINPDFTPKHLIESAASIVHVRLGLPEENGTVPCRTVSATKGAAPNVAFRFVVGDAALRESLTSCYKNEATVAALFFSGDFRGARRALGTSGKPLVGTLLVCGTYFGLERQEDGRLRLVADPYDLRTVWAGTAEMFLRMMACLQSDPSLSVPVVSGATWRRETRFDGKIEGAVSGCLAVDFFGKKRSQLLILCRDGDRLLECREGALLDLTVSAALTSRSRLAAVADLTGDGRPDIASWDGTKLRLYRQRDGGVFEESPTAMPASSPLLSLSAIDAGNGASGLLAGTAEGPVMIVPDGGRGFAERKLEGGGGDNAEEAGGPCVVADFDADGLQDVLQIGRKRLFLFQGKGPGVFAAPAPAGRSAVAGVRPPFAIGDYAADGLLDVYATGSSGSALYLNGGDGKFVEQVQESGELGYDDKLEASAATVADVNNDGRLDLVCAFTNRLPFVFFNRGFCTFGVANDLLFEGVGAHGAETSGALKAAEELRSGQQAIAAADLDGDGVQEICFVTAVGSLWTIAPNPGSKLSLGLEVELPFTRNGPVSVVAQTGRRCLGARHLEPGGTAFFGVRNQGAVHLKWTEGGAKKERRVILRQPVRVELSAEEQVK